MAVKCDCEEETPRLFTTTTRDKQEVHDKRKRWQCSFWLKRDTINPKRKTFSSPFGQKNKKINASCSSTEPSLVQKKHLRLVYIYFLVGKHKMTVQKTAVCVITDEWISHQCLKSPRTLKYTNSIKTQRQLSLILCTIFSIHVAFWMLSEEAPTKVAHIEMEIDCEEAF